MGLSNPKRRAKRAANLEQYRAAARKRYATDYASIRGRAMRLLAEARGRSRTRGLAYDLDAVWLIERLKTGCELTGRPFFLGSNAGIRIDSPSLDRIDPLGDYTKSNTRVVLWGLNAAGNTWGLKAIVELIDEARARDKC